MSYRTAITRLLDAFLTALAVVFGLIPDPTVEPEPVSIHRRPLSPSAAVSSSRPPVEAASRAR